MADLNLKFENGKAPALNADNMNKIVNEINRTNAKTKDLQSEIATLVIEKVVQLSRLIQKKFRQKPKSLID